MQQHQKYFPLFDDNNRLTNSFLLVSNLPDVKVYIKKGNQRVIEARLSDAKFFWEKNKKQNLVKQIILLKNITFFNTSASNRILYFPMVLETKLGAFEASLYN